MLCVRYRRLLVRYVECELDEQVRANVEAHVSRCSRCAGEVDMIRSVTRAIRSAQIPAMEPSPDLWAKVSARIEREAARPSSRPWIRVARPASAFAAVMFAGIVGLSLMRTGPPPKTAQAPAVRSGQPRVETHLIEPEKASSNSAVSRPRGGTPTAGIPSGAGHISPRIHTKRVGSASTSKIAKSAFSPVVGSNRARVGQPTVVTSIEETKPALVAPAAKPTEMEVTDSHADSLSPTTVRTPVGVREDPTAATRHAFSEANDAGETGFHTESTDSAYRDVAEKERTASVVDALNETEGIRSAALFAYP
ncbi:MAG: zf-HC2 domain-containing protein [Armatimonadetes bacterium]|nr:zf-HC2 domain-containing protein [Armatimonadota bacterium]